MDAPTEEALFNERETATVTCEDGERPRALKVPQVNRVHVTWLGPSSQDYLVGLVADDARGEMGPDVYHQLRRAAVSSGCVEVATNLPLSEVLAEVGARRLLRLRFQARREASLGGLVCEPRGRLPRRGDHAEL